MQNSQNEPLYGFECYCKAEKMSGIACVVLPDLEYEADARLTSKGFMDVSITEWPLKPLITTIRWIPLSKGAQMKFVAPEIYHFDFTCVKPKSTNITMRCMPKTAGLGKLYAGKITNCNVDYEALYLKIAVDGHILLEIDKLAQILVVDGRDYMWNVQKEEANKKT